MNIFRAKHDNVPESPVRTLYGRKDNFLLLPLDVCVLLTINGSDEFRPFAENTRLIAAPIQDEGDGRIGLVAQYTWPPAAGAAVNPVVLVQLAPSANVKGVDDLRVLACQVEADDVVVLTVEGSEETIEGKITQSIGRCIYPDLSHHVTAYRVTFRQHVGCRAHGTAVRLSSGELVGMLIATQNQPDGLCRALVYPA